MTPAPMTPAPMTPAPSGEISTPALSWKEELQRYFRHYCTQCKAQIHRTRNTPVEFVVCEGCRSSSWEPRCRYCYLPGDDMNEVVEHEKAHHSALGGSRYYRCKHCPDLFSHTETRRSHERTCGQNQPGFAGLQCRACSREFSSVKEMDNHDCGGQGEGNPPAGNAGA